MTELSKQIISALAEGKPQKKIAKELGCSQQYVSLLNPKREAPKSVVRDRIISAFDSDPEKTCRQIAAELQCNLKYIQKVARETNRPRRTRGERAYLKPLVLNALMQDSGNYAGIARRLGCNHTYVSHVAKNMLGLPPKCGKKITVPHNLAALPPADIVPAE